MREIYDREAAVDELEDDEQEAMTAPAPAGERPLEADAADVFDQRTEVLDPTDDEDHES